MQVTRRIQSSPTILLILIHNSSIVVKLKVALFRDAKLYLENTCRTPGTDGAMRRCGDAARAGVYNPRKPDMSAGAKRAERAALLAGRVHYTCKFIEVLVQILHTNWQLVAMHQGNAGILFNAKCDSVMFHSGIKVLL
jgi:hypothetical protein